jgi:hypothetical protein
MLSKSSVKVQVTGVAVVETVDIRLDLNEEDREEFRKHPERVFRRLLEEAGQEVNSIRVLRKPHTHLGEKPVQGSFHLVYPPGEKSGWICCCSD